MAAGDFERALEATEAYARAFPRGQLAADADALAAQALAARGERTRASERAQRFLERHPDDPHAARMRRLLDR
jgi:TolA-binding protein